MNAGHFIRLKEHALNGICPYFTMFPLSFPEYILSRYGQEGQIVLDPFCGRGTTSFAARLCKMATVGIDSSPVAVAIAQSKIVSATAEDIQNLARKIFNEEIHDLEVPKEEFWHIAFHEKVLLQLCKFRASLLKDCHSDTRKALRAIILGALHGPLGKQSYSYFSNQCPRTFAPKPNYSVNYWRKHNLQPPNVDIISIIQKRAERYYSVLLPQVEGDAILADSRQLKVFSNIPKIHWIITSPPYYGMTTYIPDQWLRLWF